MAGIEKTPLYPPLSPDDLYLAGLVFGETAEKASDPNSPKRVRGRERWLPLVLPVVVIAGLSLSLACSNVEARTPPSPTAILTVQPTPTFPTLIEASPTPEPANIQDEVKISKVTSKDIDPQDKATLENQLGRKEFVEMVNLDITSSRDRDNPNPPRLSLSIVTVQNKAGENKNYVFFRDSYDGNKVIEYGEYQAVLDVKKDTQEVMLRYRYPKGGFDFLAFTLRDTIPGTVEEIRQALRNPATQAKLIKQFNDPDNLTEVYFVNLYTNLEALYSRSNNWPIEQIIAQIITAFSPSKAYAETLPKEPPTATPTVTVINTPAIVPPSPTLKPAETATPVPTVPATVPATATKPPENTATPTSSELLQQAPEISGLKKELENGTVVYRAKKDNPWGLKEGEVAGRVINYKLVRGVEVSQIAETQGENTTGLVLHQKIIEKLYLEANTQEKLARGEWRMPICFDPENRQFTLFASKITNNNGSFITFIFTPTDSIIGLELYSPFPGIAEAVSSANINTSVPIRPSQTFVPENIAGWTMSIYTAGLETTLPSEYTKVNYGQSLLKIIRGGYITKPKLLTSVQLALLIGSKTGGKNFSFENILEYKENDRTYKVFMMKSG